MTYRFQVAMENCPNFLDGSASADRYEGNRRLADVTGGSSIANPRENRTCTGAAGGPEGMCAMTCPNSDRQVSDLTQAEAEAAVLCLINQERANASAPPLVMNLTLRKVAHEHAAA